MRAGHLPDYRVVTAVPVMVLDDDPQPKEPTTRNSKCEPNLPRNSENFAILPPSHTAETGVICILLPGAI